MTAPSSASQPEFRLLDWCKLPGLSLVRLISLLIGLLVLGLGDAAQALQKGENSAAVSDLQQRMVDAGCYGGPVTGFYGDMTQTGIVTCQRQFGLVEDGVPGPQTLAALSGQVRPTFAQPAGAETQIAQADRTADRQLEAILKRGDRGAGVLELQRKLQRLNHYSGAIDGIFGAQTEQAVIAFQRSIGLPSDGIVGTQEQAVLDEGNVPIAQPENPAAPDQITRDRLVRGDSGSDVEKLQRRLKDLQLLDSSISGFYGSLTQSAVSEFQRQQGLEMTGIANDRTLAALGLKSPAAHQTGFNLPTQRLNPAQPPAVVAVPALPAIPPRQPTGVFSDRSFTNSSTNTPVQRLPEMPRSQRFRYRVVVPEQSQTSAEVRRIVRGARAYSDAKGNFFLIGSYTNRKEADRSAMLMRAYGLDARVEFD
jgi:peptidoglycan hydrolase-like protein with peptidoglycan-binding domain